MSQLTMIGLEIEFTHNFKKGNKSCIDGNTTRCKLHLRNQQKMNNKNVWISC